MPPDPKARIEELEAEVARKDADLAALQARIAELEASAAKQAALIEQLIERAGQNSRNSHLPPSSDGPGAAKKRDKKSKGKRNRGGQKGRRGARRELIDPALVDQVVDLYPECCAGCAARLLAQPDADALRYQQIDLDLVGGRGRQITEWRRHELECPRCGARTRATYDPAVIPSALFGPTLCGVVVMFTGAYKMSRRDVSRVLRELFGILMSVGSVSNIEARASVALVRAAEEAQRAVDSADVKHADGTTWLRAGITMSLWTLAGKMATVFRIFADGKRDTIRSLFGELFGILVSDRAKVFDFWSMALRQVCWAHLLRKFIAFSERDGPAGAFGRELVESTTLVFEYWHAFLEGELTRAELEVWMRPVQRHVEALLERAVAAAIPRLSGSCADMLAHRDALWTFVTHEGVEPTNNHAERELRGAVLWRKRSFGCQSERGLRFVERVMTVVHTARKQGKDVLDFLVRTITAHEAGLTPPALIGDATPA